MLTEEARKELQDINRVRIDYWQEHPEEWDRYLEANSHDPRRFGIEPKNANDLDECSEEFRCIQCFKKLPRTQLASDGKRCQQCAGAGNEPPKNSLG